MRLPAQRTSSPPQLSVLKIANPCFAVWLLVWSLWKVETMAQSDESDQPTRVVVSSGSWTLDTSDTPPFEFVDPFTTCVRARCWGNSGRSQPKAGDSLPSRCDAPSTSSWSDFESSCRVFHQHHHPLRTKKVATSDKPKLLSPLKTWLS